MYPSPPSAERVNTGRIDEFALERVLDQLDRSTTTDASAAASRWYRYRRRLWVHLRQLGTETFVAHSMAARLLNSEGLRLIHAGYVHAHTQCVPQLVTVHGTCTGTPATVLRCAHADGLLHEVELKFARPVEVALYCPDAVAVRVLMVAEDPAAERVMTAQLKELGVRVDHAQHMAEVADAAKLSVYDAILVNRDADDIQCRDAGNELRELGFLGRIIGVGSVMRPNGSRGCCASKPCDDCIAKPLTRSALEQLICSPRAAPLLSALDVGTNLAPLIAAFVKSLPDDARDIWIAFAAGDRRRLETLAQSRGTRSRAYGFEPLAAIANAVREAAADRTPIEEVAKRVQTLRANCLRVRPLLIGSPGTSAIAQPRPAQRPTSLPPTTAAEIRPPAASW